MLGSVYQVGRSLGWNFSWVLFVLFVDCLYISFANKSVLLISASELLKKVSLPNVWFDTVLKFIPRNK